MSLAVGRVAKLSYRRHQAIWDGCCAGVDLPPDERMHASGDAPGNGPCGPCQPPRDPGRYADNTACGRRSG